MLTSQQTQQIFVATNSCGLKENHQFYVTHSFICLKCGILLSHLLKRKHTNLISEFSSGNDLSTIETINFSVSAFTFKTTAARICK